MKITALFFTLIALVHCTTAPKSVKLDGFAFYEPAPENYLYRAVTAEGVTLQVSEQKNYPKNANLQFWKDSIREWVPKKGYRIVKEADTSGGAYFIFLVPGIKYDFFYFIHFSLKNETITLTEAGGQYAYLQEYQAKILEFSQTDFSKLKEK